VDLKGGKMALKLQVDFKGTNAEYWKIIKVDTDLVRKNDTVRIGLYKDQAAREESIHNFLEVRVFYFDCSEHEHTMEDLYNHIKEPVYTPQFNEDGSPMLDENDDPVTEQTNIFVDATDV